MLESGTPLAGLSAGFVRDDDTMILCNGLPKSGTHALEKAVQLLGQVTELEHVPYADRRDGRQLLIKRHPRNVVISWLRFMSGPITEGKIIHAIQTYDGGLVGDRFAAYEGYLSDPDAHVVTFENLISDESELRGISEFLACPYIDDAFVNILGLTITWTGKLSNWSDHWTDLIDAAWAEAGGYEAEQRWNY